MDINYTGYTENVESKSNSEIERRFILKRHPQADWTAIYDIVQFYHTEGDKNLRLRKSQRVDGEGFFRELFSPTYEYLYKIKHSKGVYTEVHVDFEASQYDKIVALSEKILEKTRYVYNYDGLKFEVDLINGIDLVLMEVEVPELSHKIKFPDFLKELIIGEITGVKGFSNYDLATKCKKKRKYAIE